MRRKVEESREGDGVRLAGNNGEKESGGKEGRKEKERRGRFGEKLACNNGGKEGEKIGRRE